jgi:hypothetical protein
MKLRRDAVFRYTGNIMNRIGTASCAAALGLCAAISAYSQQNAPVPDAPSASQPGSFALAGAPLFELFDAAAGNALDWRPDWPLMFPPDMYRVSSGNAAASITVTFEIPAAFNSSPDSSGTAPPLEYAPITVRRYNGALAAFPVFLERSAETPYPCFVQGTAEYAGNGAIRRISAEGFEAEALEHDWENRPVLVRLLISGEYFFSALEYGGNRVTETRYRTDGAPASVMERDGSGGDIRAAFGADGTGTETRLALRNASGAVSELRLPAGIWSASYERRGLPRYLTWTAPVNDGVSEGAAEEPVSRTGRCIFQWDENGRLVRCTLVDTEGRALSASRYEYVLDSRGNWTERREILMRSAGERFFSAPGPVIRRRIIYREKP